MALKPLGVRAADLEYFDVCGIIDLIEAYVEQEAGDSGEMEATQEDYDEF